MTRIITSDEQLRKFIPNVFATAQGETPLFDKVLPWLETAERWLFSMSWDFSCEPSAMPNPFEHCRGDAENGGEHFSLTQRSHAQVIERLRSVIVSTLRGNALNVPSLRDIVDFMRKNEEQFAEFRHSDTYRLYEPPIFENKKKSHGYFF